MTLRERERYLWELQEGIPLGDARRALQLAARAYIQELADRGALHHNMTQEDVAFATASVLESIDNNRFIDVKDWILEWLQS